MVAFVHYSLYCFHILQPAVTKIQPDPWKACVTNSIFRVIYHFGILPALESLQSACCNLACPLELAYLHSINQYLLGWTSSSTMSKALYINCHHFSSSLLKWHNYNLELGLGTLITMSQAIVIHKLDFGRNRFTTDEN